MYALNQSNPNILFHADTWYEQVSSIVVEQIITDELWQANNGGLGTVASQDKVDFLKNSWYYFCNLEPLDENDQRYLDLVSHYEEYEGAIEGCRAHPVLSFVLLMYVEGVVNDYSDWEKAYRINHKGQMPGYQDNSPSTQEVVDKFIDMADYFRKSGIFNGPMMGSSQVDVFVNEIANIPIDMRTVMKIAKKFSNSQKMTEILKLCGQIQSTVNDRKMGVRKTEFAEGETKGFTQSSDITRMTTGQLIKRIQSPLAFRSDIAQGTLETKQQQGLAQTRGGPIIIVFDESGSMQGENETWAKALGIFLVQEAIRQNRTVAVVSFAEKARGPNIYRPRNFDTDKFLDEEIIKFASGGGTKFHHALRAVADINDARKGWDVVFITDGMDGSNYESFTKQLERVRAHNTRIMGISIDYDVSDRMKEMCDDCLVVNTRNRKDLMDKSDTVLQWLEKSTQLTI